MTLNEGGSETQSGEEGGQAYRNHCKRKETEIFRWEEARQDHANPKL